MLAGVSSVMPKIRIRIPLCDNTYPTSESFFPASLKKAKTNGMSTRLKVTVNTYYLHNLSGDRSARRYIHATAPSPVPSSAPGR